MIHKIIIDHVDTSHNLEPEQIRERIKSEGISLDLKSLATRINEFKKTQAYRDRFPETPNS